MGGRLSSAIQGLELPFIRRLHWGHHGFARSLLQSSRHSNAAAGAVHSAGVIESDETYTSPSYTRVYPLAVKRGLGAAIEDVDGNVFLDFTAGIAVCTTGHCHPRMVGAIQAQAANLLHMSGTDFYNEPQRDLAPLWRRSFPEKSRKRSFLH